MLITGVYGAGKSTVAEELVDHLEQRGLPYALLDLDFLGWFYGGDDDAEKRVRLANVAAVVANFRAAGVRLFVLAGSVFDRDEVDGLAEAVGAPLRVVRLTVPLAEVERRLRASAATEARIRDDLPRAGEMVAGSLGVGVEDLAVSNEGPARQVAGDIAEWLGWV